jgi:ABC-type bacteriocin/lantibiotic exporter with double-glycine peptidase domain
MKKLIPYYSFTPLSFVCDYYFAISLIQFNLTHLIFYFFCGSVCSILANLSYQNLLEKFNHKIRLNFTTERLMMPLARSFESSMNFLQEILPRAIDFYGIKIKSVELAFKVLAYSIALIVKAPPEIIYKTWPFAILLPTSFLLKNYIKKMGEALFEKSSVINKDFVQIIMSALFLRVHGLETKGLHKSQENLSFQKKLLLKSHIIASLAQKLPTLLYFILFLIIYKLVQYDQTLALFYLGYKLIQNFSDFINCYSNQELYAKQFKEALQYLNVPDKPTDQNIKFKSAPSLSFENYNLKSGELLFITGPSGSGKTTLIYKLMQLLPKKEVRWNQQEIKLDQLKHSLSYVGAANFFIEGTVKDNLLLGLNSNPSDDEIWQALKFFFIDEVVNAKKDKMNESIAHFSSGEKQRLALSRAYLRNPVIYFFDEATKHLDEELSNNVIKQIASLKKQATIIVSDHKNEFLKYSDCSIALNKKYLV